MEEGFLVSNEMWYRNSTWADERPDEITVYYCKPDNWSTANIYYYLNDNDTGPVLPGTTMTEVADGWNDMIVIEQMDFLEETYAEKDFIQLIS